MAVQTQIQTRRGSAATWTSTNPTLAAGEIGFESDTNKFKIGTGSTAWVSLPYASNVSPLTTKGDLYTYSTDNARLAVGANGETLVADSSTSTGLRYQAPYAQQPILNSSFQIWQRGTSPTWIANNAGNYTADRWLAYSVAADRTVTRQATGDTTNLPFIQYCARVQRTNANAATDQIRFLQLLETVNSIPFAGKTVTMSFYARKGADFSAASNNLTVTLGSGTGTDQNVIFPGYSGYANVINSTATLTTTWQRFTFTGTVGTTATELTTLFDYTPVGTAGAADYYEITGVQLEVGSVATPFHTYAATLQGELAACQRYYLKSYNQVTAPGTASNTVGNFGYSTISTTNTKNRGNVRFPVAMRTTPTITLYSTSTGTSAKIFNEQTAADLDGAAQYIGESGFHAYPSSGVVSDTGQQLLFHYVASAEL